MGVYAQNLWVYKYIQFGLVNILLNLPMELFSSKGSGRYVFGLILLLSDFRNYRKEICGGFLLAKETLLNIFFKFFHF